LPVGIYISVPFCRTKCSYCNFASDVFSRVVFERYVDQVCTEIQNAPKTAAIMGGKFERFVDSIYLGGGTPTVLESAQLHRIFAAVRNNFDVEEGAEITVECAPGTLPDDQLEGLLRCGVNRVSLGVQSFVDQEAAAVGRLTQTRETVLADIDSPAIAGHHQPQRRSDRRTSRIRPAAELGRNRSIKRWRQTVSARQRLHARSRRRFAAGPRG
jgi:oxygen-independent coproporphyrinogen-3 oxidase